MFITRDRQISPGLKNPLIDVLTNDPRSFTTEMQRMSGTSLVILLVVIGFTTSLATNTATYDPEEIVVDGKVQFPRYQLLVLEVRHDSFLPKNPIYTHSLYVSLLSSFAWLCT